MASDWFKGTPDIPPATRPAKIDSIDRARFFGPDAYDAEPGLYSLRFTADGAAIAAPEPLLPGSVSDLAAADLDAGGRDDLVALISDPDTSALTIVPATADAWGPPRALALPADVPWAYPLAVGDLDLDGTLDAALTSPAGLLRYMDVAADPPTPPQQDPLTLPQADALTVADADADGRPDLVAVSRESGLTVVRAADDGTWEPQPPFNSYFFNWALHVDADLRPLAALADSGALTVVTTDLAPGFSPLARFQGGGAAQLDTVVAGDLDADGIFSTYERSGAADQQGVNASIGLYIDQEVE